MAKEDGQQLTPEQLAELFKWYPLFLSSVFGKTGFVSEHGNVSGDILRITATSGDLLRYEEIPLYKQ